MSKNAINSLDFNNNQYIFTLPYGVCSTGATTAAKTVTVDNFSLETGAMVTVKFSNDNSASTPTLNVSSTGAKQIWYDGAVISATKLQGRTYTFVYDGSYWQLIGDIDTNTTSFTITATAEDDDIVILTGTNGSNKVTYKAEHAKKGPIDGYTSGNTTTSISGSGGTGTIKIPQLTVDEYGHVTAAGDEDITITMPTLPTALKNPKALTIKGAGTSAASYDGSDGKTVDIVAGNNNVTVAAENGKISISSQDTHYQSKNVVTSSATSKSDTKSVSNGNVYLNLVENDTVRSSHKIKGSGATTVTVNSSGEIVINSTNNTYSAGTGLTLNGTTFNHTNNIAAGTANDGGNDRQLAFEGTFKIPSIEYDSEGHIKSVSATTLTMPKNPNTDTHYESKLIVNNQNTSTNNTTTALTNGNVKLNLIENNTVRSSHKITGSGATTVTTDASGNIVISSTDNDTKYTHPSYTARTGEPTANQTPGFGGTFNVGQTVSDSLGHVTAVNTKTVTIPNTLATTSARGLMSPEDKEKIDDTNIAYGTCSTDAATAEKVITIINNDNWTLKTGSLITVKFANTNTAASPTLNVNGTGAKSIYYNNAVYTSSSSYGGYKNRHITYQYDGTYWVFICWSYDTNSDTKVTQSAAITTNGEYPVILGYSTSTSSVTNTVNKTSTLKYNPSTQILTTPKLKLSNATADKLAIINNNQQVVSHGDSDTLTIDGGHWTIAIGDCCFEAGTQVQTTLDGQTKNIEDFKTGDVVISYDINSKEYHEAICKKLIINKHTIHIAKVILEDGTYLVMNEYHPILTEDGFHSITRHNGYDPLYIGDKAVTNSGLKEIVKIERTWLKEPLITYNLDTINYDEIDVDDDTNDTYIANGVVVHNAACPA